MAESYGFFDAEELVGGEFDREYLAEQFANYFKLFIGNGVFASPTNQLKVVAGTGLQIILKRGWAFINGYWYYNDDDLEIPVPPNVTAQTVNSGVFVQFNSADRTIHTVIATGRTTVDRDAPYYELKLAELSIATGTTAISDAMITDTRTNENVCGFVKGLLEGVISTDDLFAQYTAIFNEWFDHMKDQLSEDAAGNLQEQIDEIDETLNNLNASTVSFDDTTAQIGSNTVQGAIEGLKSAFSSALTALKNTAIAQAVGATVSDNFAQVIAKLATIVNRGKVTQTLNTSTKSYTIPAGYHNGQGTVSLTTQEKTITASRSAQTVTPDSGKVLSKVTVNKFPDATGSYPASGNITSNGTHDMGAGNNYRYVKVDVHPTPSCPTLIDQAITNHSGGSNVVSINVPTGYQRYVAIVGIHRYNNDSTPNVSGCGAIWTGSLGKLYDSSYAVYVLTSGGTLNMWTNHGWLMWVTVVGINS